MMDIGTTRMTECGTVRMGYAPETPWERVRRWWYWNSPDVLLGVCLLALAVMGAGAEIIPFMILGAVVVFAGGSR